jgi:cardiolipin synthase
MKARARHSWDQKQIWEKHRRLESWTFVVLIILVLGMGIMLWSAQRGRKVYLRVAHIDNLQEALPSIVGATHGTMVGGNRIELIQNGDFFPVLLATIAGARETVHLESYVWWKGDICGQVADALAAKARQGVEVRVLLDASGSLRMDHELLERMRGAGVKVVKYGPPTLKNIAKINLRDHRKILVVDGRLGLVFGHGIAQEWTGHAQDAEHWRDTGARVQGPIVGQLQSAFSDNWVQETGEVLVGPRYYPPLPPAGSSFAHLAYDARPGSVSDVDLLFRVAFEAAQHELWVQNPYLAADPDVLVLLTAAARRGVDVRVMLPGPVTDAQFVRHAGHNQFERLLRSGVHLYEYQRTLNHQKIIIVDRLWSHVGSTNFDNRSFESNKEISLGIVDPAIAAQLRAAFLADQRESKEILLQEWRKEPALHRLRDKIAWRLNELL